MQTCAHSSSYSRTILSHAIYSFTYSATDSKSCHASKCTIQLTHRWHHFCHFTRKGHKASATVIVMLFCVQVSSRAASVGGLCLSKSSMNKKIKWWQRWSFWLIFYCLLHTWRHVCEYYSQALSRITLSAVLVSSLTVYLAILCYYLTMLKSKFS